MSEIVVGHAAAVIGDDDAILAEVQMDGSRPSVERILDQLKDGDLVIRNEFAAKHALQARADIEMQFFLLSCAHVSLVLFSVHT